MGDGLCETCGCKTIIDRGEYRRFCSTKCAANNKNLTLIKSKTKKKKYKNGYFNTEKFKQTNLKRYGTTCVFQNKDIIKKIKETKKKRYKDENYNNQSKREKTNFKKFGVKAPLQNSEIKEKTKNTNLKRYGQKCVFQNNEVKKKSKQTNLKRYGVEYPIQNKEIFKRGQKTRFLVHNFKDTNLTYQGSYELDFLEKFYDKIDINSGPSIPYLFEGKNKIYHSDFYISSKNLVVEIKSTYFNNLYIFKNQAKEKATISNGFNYILILDKNYSELEKY